MQQVRSTAETIEGNGGFDYLGVNFRQLPHDPDEQYRAEAAAQGNLERDDEGRIILPVVPVWETQLEVKGLQEGSDGKVDMNTLFQRLKDLKHAHFDTGNREWW